jgi:cell division protein FtsB
MSRFTRCPSPARRPNALPPTTVLKILLALSMVLAFGLAHIHLRVRLGQLRREVSTLQGDQGRLLSEINAVRTQNEALKTPKNLQLYARNELGMVAYNSARREMIVMPEEIQTRYALARATSERMLARSDQDDRQERWLTTLGERIGLIGDALAEESGR